MQVVAGRGVFDRGGAHLFMLFSCRWGNFSAGRGSGIQLSLHDPDGVQRVRGAEERRELIPGFGALGLQTFLTAGSKESRAWTIKKGATAPEAAGIIHPRRQE